MPGKIDGVNGRPRLAVLAGILAPYRKPIFQRLNDTYTPLVLVSGREHVRGWDTNDSQASFQVKTVRSITLERRLLAADGRTKDLKYYNLTLGYLWELIRFRPNAIISGAMGPRSMTAMIYGAAFRVPVWLWWGGTPHTERDRSRLARWIRSWFFSRFVRRWISYGETSTDYLLTLGVPRERVLQVQNCVDDCLFHSNVEPYPLDVPQPRALFVGQLVGRKGMEPLLEAATAAQRSGVESSLVIVGSGPEGQNIEETARRLGFQHVQRINYVPPEKMASVYRACDFLVFPTLEDVWGLVVNEALLTGTPVIASKYAGCAQELLPPENIFDPLSSASFIAAYRRAALGQISPPDRNRLRSTREVADIIASDIMHRLKSKEQ